MKFEVFSKFKDGHTGLYIEVAEISENLRDAISILEGLFGFGA